MGVARKSIVQIYCFNLLVTISHFQNEFRQCERYREANKTAKYDSNNNKMNADSYNNERLLDVADSLVRVRLRRERGEGERERE